MATSVVNQAADAAPVGDEVAYAAVRARRRVQLQLLGHVVFVAAALAVGAYLAVNGGGGGAEGEAAGVTTAALLQQLAYWLVGGIGLGAILFWVLPALAGNKKSAPYVFVSPFFILFFTFALFPILFSLFLSFFRWEPSSGLAGMEFAGWDHWHGIPIPDNFTYAAGDRLFGTSLYNTFWIAVVSGVPQHVVGMPLAYFFHVAFRRFRNLITGAYFLPFITSSVAIALIFGTLYSQHFGIINATIDAIHRLLGGIHIGSLYLFDWIPHGQEGHINWLGKAPTVKPAISFVVFWRYLGWNTVLYLSALQAIPKDLFEAAEMDGASRWQTFSRVVLPLLRPMMLFAVTLTIIGNLQLFEDPYIITGTSVGGPESAGQTTAMFMYKYGFEQVGEYGTACAISWMLFILIALLTWVNNWIFSRARGSEGVA